MMTTVGPDLVFDRIHRRVVGVDPAGVGKVVCPGRGYNTRSGDLRVIAQGVPNSRKRLILDASGHLPDHHRAEPSWPPAFVAGREPSIPSDQRLRTSRAGPARKDGMEVSWGGWFRPPHLCHTKPRGQRLNRNYPPDIRCLTSRAWSL